MGSAIDSSNNIYITGFIGQNFLNTPPAMGSTLQINTSGTVLNSGSFYSPIQNGTYNTMGLSVDVDFSGNTYWGGYAQTSQFVANKGTNYYVTNAFVVKDTNAFQGTHAGNYTLNSYLSIAWNKTYPVAASSFTMPTPSGSTTATSISSSNWSSLTVATNNALSGGQPGIVAALVTI